MKPTFSNNAAKLYLARFGPSKVFGLDVDRREAFSDVEAAERFDGIWNANLALAASDGDPCDLDSVRRKVPEKSHGYINQNAIHKEFSWAGCLFICQFVDLQTCDQLWFISSTSGDPRTLYVRFQTVDARESFGQMSRRLGWQSPESLAEKILLDFASSVTCHQKQPGQPHGSGRQE